MGLLNPMRDKHLRQEPRGKRDDTCDHGLSRNWKVKVWGVKRKKKALSLLVAREPRGETNNKDTGTHEGHASQHRPTTHPLLGVLSQLAASGRNACRPWSGLRDLLPGALLSPRQALFLAFFASLWIFYFFSRFCFVLPFFAFQHTHTLFLPVASLVILPSPIRWITGSSGPLLCDRHVESEATTALRQQLFDVLSPRACFLFVGHYYSNYIWQSNKESSLYFFGAICLS